MITDLGDGTYNVEYTPYEEGKYKAAFVYFLFQSF